MKAIVRTFTLSVTINSDDNVFPQMIDFQDRSVYGVIGHTNNDADTRTNVLGSLLVEKEASVFVRLEGTEGCDSKIMNLPLESLLMDNKEIPYFPLSIGKLARENCTVKVLGSGGTKDGSRVVMLTFITD